MQKKKSFDGSRKPPIRLNLLPFPFQKLLDRDLIEAVADGKLYNAKTALEKGASPNARDSRNRTALMIAAGENFVEIAETLLRSGANPLLLDSGKHDALWHAGIYHNKRMIRLLENARTDAA